MKVMGIVVGVLVVLGLVGSMVQRSWDGPRGPLPGGELRSGPLVRDASIDWPTVFGTKGQCIDDECAPMESIELQLVDPPTSRTTGVMVHEGQLYVPCDLGYMWGRFEGRQRYILNLIYLFKDWHEHAARDGRAVLRIDGSRYELQAVRVTDPELIVALKLQLEEMARNWVAPEPLAEAPTEGPNDIWFFRMDPRGATEVASEPVQENRT